VTLTNDSTGVARSTTPNKVSAYHFPNLAPGNYTLDGVQVTDLRNQASTDADRPELAEARARARR